MAFKNMEIYSEIKRNGGIPISFSQLQMFNQCPYKWKCVYIDKLKDISNSINLIYGNAIHEAIQSYLQVYYASTKTAADDLDMREIFTNSMISQFKSCDDKSFVSKDEFKEFMQDGYNFIDEFKRRCKFQKRGCKLIGVELLLKMAVKDNIIFTGFIDFALQFDNGTVEIYDIKTSTNSWQEDKKKNPETALQLLLYKEYFSKLFNVPIDKIKVIFYIAKRKVFENSAYPQKRIQIYAPPCGKGKLKAAVDNINNFVNSAFINNTYNLQYNYTTNRSPLCAYCHLKKEHCSEWKK